MACRNTLISVLDTAGTVLLGVWDTLNVQSQQFNILPWIEAYGDGALLIIAQRKNDELPYEVANVSVADGIATWTFDEVDTAVPGYGSVALVYLVGGEYKARTVPYQTYTAPTIGMTGTAPPDPLESWYNRMLQASADAQDAAEQSANSASAAADSADAAQSSADDAQEDALEAEAWATGTRNGEAVPPSAPQYENNSKYYAEQAAHSGDPNVTFLFEELNADIDLDGYYTAEEVDEKIAASAGEENVIDGISVNGSPLAPDEEKVVDIPVPIVSGDGHDKAVYIDDAETGVGLFAMPASCGMRLGLHVDGDEIAENLTSEQHVAEAISAAKQELRKTNVWLLLQDILADIDMPIATETEVGGIRLDAADAIEVDEDGRLKIGGRMGQFPGGGIYYPAERTPTEIGPNTFIISDANNGDFPASRSLAVVTGAGITLTGAHAAGSTEYRVADTYINRIFLSEIAGSRAGASEVASYDLTVPILSVTINGTAFTPISPAFGSDPIVITTDGSANPDAEITQLRITGKLDGFCDIAVGQCVACASGGSPGVSVLVGQRVVSRGNANAIIGADVLNTGNGNGLFGRHHYNIKNRWLIAGTGHNTSNGRSESGVALGQWSLVTPTTLLALGNGTDNDNRLNVFEITSEKGGTAKVNNIEAENGRLEFKDSVDVAPIIVPANWTLSGSATIEDYAGTPGFRLVDTSGTSSYATGRPETIVPVTPGEVLEWSFSARKTSESVTGKLYLNLIKCTATGGSAVNNFVQNGAATEYSTDWDTFSGSFTVPDGMEYLRVRVGRSNAGAGSDGFYEVKDLSIRKKTDSGIYLTSPGGAKFKIAVADDGTLTTIPVI